MTPKPLEMPWDSEEGAGLGDASTLSEDSPVMPADDAEVSGETADADAPADVTTEPPADDAAPAEEVVPDATDAAPEQPEAEAPDQDAEAQLEN